MIKGQPRVGLSANSVIHARTVNERGQIVPRCSAHRKTLKNVLDVTVTAAVKRVNCGRCREALS